MRKSIILALVGGLVLTALAPVAQSKPSKELKLFLRWDGDGSTCGATYLSVEDGPDPGNGCAFRYQVAQEVLTAAGTPLIHEWPGMLSKPVTITAGKAKGSFTVRAYAAVQTTLQVEVRAMTSKGSVTIGAFTSGVINAGPTTATPVEFELDIPKGLVNKKIESVSMSTSFRGVSMQSYIELDNPAAFITLPTK